MMGLCSPLTADDPEYDLVIRGGRIVDGTGNPWYEADVGIAGGRIVRIGRIDEKAGRRVISAQGLIVAPGFIDMMGQTATPMVVDPKSAINLLTQGITTINAGEGASAAPLGAEQGSRLGWTTMAEYFQWLDMAGLPVNVVQTVGHTQVRRIVMGEVDRRPTEEELQQMCGLVREAMEAGAIGVSTALIYPPAVYAEIEEIAALAKVAGEHGGGYYTHMRNEGDRLLDAIDEALEIGKQGGTPVHIFHLKAAGRQNWDKMPLAIARIQAARGEGRQVTADIYPYINNGLGIAAFIHPRHFGEGHAKLVARLDDAEFRAEVRKEMETTSGWENWFRHVGQDWDRVVIGQTGHKEYQALVGRSVAAIAAETKTDPWDVFFNLVRGGAFACPQTMTEANLIRAMQQEFVSFCTDVGPAGGDSSASHPRAFGAFPRLLSRYARDLGAISLERAVAQASAGACNKVRLYDRGRIAEGLAADLIVFDYAGLADRATFAQPHEVAVGMKFVVVNGVLVLDEGKQTDARPGRVLHGPGYRPETAPHQISQGELDPSLAAYDRMMRDFMEAHCIPGAAIAVTDQGRLVLARSYGYADVATHESVLPTSLFRIASVSKPITALAILQLVEQGKLKLDDKVFDLLDFNAEIAGQKEFDTRQRDITIRQLLEHRGGWDRDKSFDAMFQSVRFAKELGVPAPADRSDVIRAMLLQKLDFAPGERYAYSNYGYCLLGRVIEKLTGQSYEDYVREHVLAPVGVQAMRIGRSRLDGRSPHEVRYYHPAFGDSVFESDLGQRCPPSYGDWFLESMDSHGGWIASAVDLARVAAALDDPDHCPILSRESIEAMYTADSPVEGENDAKTETREYYSLGWSNRIVGDGQVDHWHTGSLPGTATILLRRHDGRNLVVLFNSRVSPQATHLGREITRRLHETTDSITDWPEIDLFDDFSQVRAAKGANSR
jgi:N-acyl-D-amino-acid deacylase